MTDGNAMGSMTIEGQTVQPLLFPNRRPHDAREIVKIDIMQFKPKIAFVLENVLSESECKLVIEKGENLGFGETHYNKKYRDNLRILCSSKSLADVVLERIRPFLVEEFEVDKRNPDDSAFSSKYLGAPNGFYKLSHLNDLWRLCKYNEGGKFLPHYDGIYVQDKCTRSFLTFMIYLNGDVDGGNTRFLSESPSLRGDDRVIHRIVPKPGSVLVFSHDIYHDGETVKSGLKYIIRSDVMYKRDDPLQDPEKLAKEREARALLSTAIDLEKTNPSEAVKYYRKAFMMCPELQSEY